MSGLTRDHSIATDQEVPGSNLIVSWPIWAQVGWEIFCERHGADSLTGSGAGWSSALRLGRRGRGFESRLPDSKLATEVG